MEKEIKIIKWEQNFLHHRIASAVKRTEFVSDRVSYIVLRGAGVLSFFNVNAPSAEKHDDSKDRFCKEFKQVPL